MSGQPREQALRSERLLAEVTRCLSEILMAESVREVLPEALTAVARVVRIDRMMVLEYIESRRAPEPYFVWSSPSAPARLDFEAAITSTREPARIREWAQPLRAGQPLVAHLSTSEGAVRSLLESLGVRSVLQVPIFVAGTYWGHIAFEDCHSERDWDGAEVNVLKILADLIGAAVTRERWLEELRRAHSTDALTGLANRTFFNQRLERLFAEARQGGDGFALLYVDLDGFKEVNDGHGHPVGDRLLQAVAARLTGTGESVALVARLGGDEFALLQQPGTLESGATLAERLIAELGRPFRIGNDELDIGASIGVAAFADDAADPDALLVRADQALYRAKQAGRGQYRIHSERLAREALEWRALADACRLAMARGELEIHYQAQFELASGALAGMEALLRWRHPERGLLLPEEFLPAVERAGFAQPLGRWVLDAACRQLSLWRAASTPAPRLAINVALAQIRAGRQFVEEVAASLARWSLSGSDLELEVTEGILARATPAQHEVLNSLRLLGVGLAIDDFGAEYSSLYYLRAYGVRRVKIASAVIAAPGEDTLQAVAALAAALGIEVVVEALEYERQRARLGDFAVRALGQGHLFSPVMSASEASALLAAHGRGHGREGN